MSRSNHNRSEFKPQSRFVEVKSKLDAEYRRFVIDTSRSATMNFEGFHHLLQSLHHLGGIPFTIWFTDNEGDLLPINNDDNFASSVKTTKRLLRLSILKSGESIETLARKRNTGGTSALLSSGLGLGLLGSRNKQHVNLPVISSPEDFRRVSAIIDIDVVPETCRRVKLMKSGASDRPLGFYIRDGASIRVTAQGLEKVSGVFISRLAAGGLAESTGLLAVGDEILEVNGIEVYGKTLDQVTDMMVANSNNLIITVKPVNQHNNIVPKRNKNHHSYRIEEERVEAAVPNTVQQHFVDGNIPHQNIQENFPSVNTSENRSAPRVSTRILPSGVQVLEL